MGEGREVLANGQGGGLGAKSAHLDGGHIFKGGGSKSSGFDRDRFKAF